MFFKKLIILLFLASLFSCKKDEIDYLKKGKWNLEWTGSVTYKGYVNFKSRGRGVFLESATDKKYSFSYSVIGRTASFKWESPNFPNSTQAFNIVIRDETIQVWEEKKAGGSTFVIRR